MLTTRRNFLSLLAAPAIVRASSLMPVRALLPPPDSYSLLDVAVVRPNRQTYLYRLILEYGEFNIPPLLSAEEVAKLEWRHQLYDAADAESFRVALAP